MLVGSSGLVSGLLRVLQALKVDAAAFRSDEAEFSIEGFGTVGEKSNALQPSNLIVVKHTAHHPAPKPLATIGLSNIDITEVCVRGIVSDDAGKTDLSLIFEKREAERVGDGPRENRAREPGGPTSCSEKTVHCVKIERAGIGSDTVVPSVPFLPCAKLRQSNDSPSDIEMKQ